jgi:hypothetical protein
LFLATLRTLAAGLIVDLDAVLVFAFADCWATGFLLGLALRAASLSLAWLASGTATNKHKVKQGVRRRRKNGRLDVVKAVLSGAKIHQILASVIET